MKNLLFTFLILFACIGGAFAQTVETRCFQNGSLKDNHVLRFETSGAKVTGLYSITRNYDPGEEEVYYFGGTRAGDQLIFNFEKYAKLQSPPFEIKKAILILAKSGERETLKAKFYGRGRRAVYALDFEECEPNYAALVKNAARISFVKGANAAMLNVKFSNQNEQKSFLLAAKKGQAVTVDAAGCAVSLRYPDKTAYEEGWAIDVFAMNLPQTGDYLFLIKPASDTRECRVNFKIEN